MTLTCEWNAISFCFLLALLLATGVSECWNWSLLGELIFVCASWWIIALFQWRTGSTHKKCKLFCCLTKHIYRLEHQLFTNKNLIKVYFSFRLKTWSFERFHEMKCFAWASKHWGPKLRESISCESAEPEASLCRSLPGRVPARGATIKTGMMKMCL